MILRWTNVGMRRDHRPWWLAALLLLLAAAASAGEFDQGLLWQVERHGKVSWLFGTMHNDDRRVTHLAAPVAKAFESANSVVLEIDPDEGAEVAAAAMIFRDGRDLQRVAGASLYRKASDAMLARGVPREATRTMKPWAVAVTLSMPRRSSGEFLNLMLYRRALSADLPIHPLETPREQLALFESLSMEEQLSLLRDTVAMLDELPGIIDRLTQAYLARDLAAMMALIERQRPSDPALAERIDREMIVERNRRMTGRLILRLREGGAFIAVGAAHLHGEEGIPSLLARRGYRLTRLY